MRILLIHFNFLNPANGKKRKMVICSIIKVIFYLKTGGPKEIATVTIYIVLNFQYSLKFNLSQS